MPPTAKGSNLIHSLTIWVDADACPNAVKEILFRAADRVKVHIILVANQTLRTPASPFIRSLQVAPGFDVADNYIVQQLKPNDLVITADIPLAAEVVARECHALNPRGEFYSKENIKQRLQMRDFMEEMRSTGQVSDGPAPFGQNERQAFANALDRFLIKQLKK
jgi:uncharacterized protein YaiI (UPF0178 family)